MSGGERAAGRPALGAIGEGLIELSLGSHSRAAELGFGGDAANVCVMAARLGVPARLAGRVGDDPLGQRLVSFWNRQGVSVEAIRRDPDAPTGLYVNTSALGGHRFTYLRNGSAGSRVDPGDIAPSFFAGLGMLLVTGVTLSVSRSSARAAEHAVAAARAHGAPVACLLNHRPALGGDVGELAQLARGSDVVIASREDVLAVFGPRDPDVLFGELKSDGAELVLTDGDRPATVTTPEGTAAQPVPRRRVRNAAGAGDALAGAYLAARLEGVAPLPSLRLGVAAATLSVRTAGCAASYPRGTMVRAFADRLDPALRGASPVAARS